MNLTSEKVKCGRKCCPFESMQYCISLIVRIYIFTYISLNYVIYGQGYYSLCPFIHLVLFIERSWHYVICRNGSKRDLSGFRQEFTVLLLEKNTWCPLFPLHCCQQTSTSCFRGIKHKKNVPPPHALQQIRGKELNGTWLS